MKRALAVCVLAGLSAPAFAANYLDARFAGASTEVELPYDQAVANGFQDIKTDNGTGFAVSGQADLAPNLFARISYVSTSADRVKVDGTTYDATVDESFLRAGLGLQGTSSVLRYYGAVEYVDAKLKIEGEDGSDNGFAVVGGLGDLGSSAFLWNVELGYVKIGSADGAVFSFDLGYRFNPHIAIILGGEGYALEDDESVKYDVSHTTLGARYTF